RTGAQAEIRSDIELQRQSQKSVGRIDAGQLKQAQGFVISAEQDVLTIVQQMTLPLDAARASAELMRGLEQTDGDSVTGQSGSCRKASATATDNCNAGHADAVTPRS